MQGDAGVVKVKITLKQLWNFFLYIGDEYIKAKADNNESWDDLSKSEIQALISKLDLLLFSDSNSTVNTSKYVTHLLAKAWFGVRMGTEELEYLLVHNIFEVVNTNYGDFIDGRDIKYTVAVLLMGKYYLFVYYKDFFTQERVFVPQRLVGVERNITTCPLQVVKYTVAEEM